GGGPRGPPPHAHAAPRRGLPGRPGVARGGGAARRGGPGGARRPGGPRLRPAVGHEPHVRGREARARDALRRRAPSRPAFARTPPPYRRNSVSHYHDSADLKILGEFKKLAPAEFKGFVELDAIVGRDDGKIPRKYRELLALAVACTTQCPYCLDVHTRHANAAGAT